MMKKTKLPLLLLPVFLLGGCQPSVTPQEETVTDLIGRQVALTPASFKKVVCVGAGALRLYSYVGDVSLLAGVEDIDNPDNAALTSRPKMFDSVARPYVMAYHEQFAKLPSCGVGGPNAQTAEAEKILSCAPDIVISEYEDVAKEDALQSALNVPVITLRYGYKGIFDETIQKSITLLGKIFGKEARAQTLNAFINSEREALVATLPSTPSSKQVYICGLGNWGTTDYLMTAQNYEPFNVAHINNVVSGLAKDGIQKIEKEKFLALAPTIDTMIVDAAAVKNIKPLYQADPTIFNSCKAWQNGEVYLQMAYNAYYTNVEIALANTWYNAKAVYPTEFAGIDMANKTNAISKAFLGKEIAREIFAAPSSFGGYQKINTATFFA
jgi:iron complex transport system substrate-binding protein